MVGENILLDAIDRGLAMSKMSKLEGCLSEGELSGSANILSSSLVFPTAYRVGFSEASSSGKPKRRNKPRKRPHISNKRPRGVFVATLAVIEGLKEGVSVGKVTKRKAEGEAYIYLTSNGVSIIVKCADWNTESFDKSYGFSAYSCPNSRHVCKYIPKV
ncbi:unnamed protein product [Arabis nemorensis]|uniref:Uncharacterized protein n=1 Tax=Arabis nemorensis TaxID=586526 RepID=A0A565CVJ6_9BRAS|nr:unnamed protein product [Arabis nemorensis]